MQHHTQLHSAPSILRTNHAIYLCLVKHPKCHQGTLIPSPANSDDEAEDSAPPADGLPRLKHIQKVSHVRNLSIFLDNNHSFSIVSHIIFFISRTRLLAATSSLISAKASLIRYNTRRFI
jgi:hypothetical protein